MNATIDKKELVSFRKEPPWFYDGPGELGRDSVLLIHESLIRGGEQSHREINQYLHDKYGYGFGVNTIDKAFGILRHHGYNVSGPKSIPDGSKQGHHFVYWLVMNSGKLQYDYSVSQEPKKKHWETMTLKEKIAECRRILAGYPDGNAQRASIEQNIADLERLARSMGEI